MNEQLLSEIAALEGQIRIFTNDRDNAASDSTKSALQAEIDAAQAKIEQRRAQIAAVETEVQATQTAISDAFNMIVVDGDAFSLRDFARDEASAQLLYAWFQQKAGEIAQQYSAQAQSYKSENADIKAELQEKDARINLVQSDNDRLGMQNADLQAKRDAAGDIIAEHEATIKRLNDDLTQLREQTAPKPAGPTNMGGNLKELMKAALESRPAIYNYVNHGFNKNTANLATTGEAISFIDIDKGKYRIVSEEEALQFRTEEAEPVEADPVYDQPLGDSVEPPALPSEGEVQVGLGMAESNVGTQVAGKTLEERIEALEQAVFGKVEQAA